MWIRHAVRLLPTLLIVMGTVYALATPRQFTAAPLFAAAPLIAAPFFSFTGTLLTGLAATITMAGLHVEDSSQDEAHAYTEEFTILTVSVLALAINRMIRRGGEQLASARQVAEAVQSAVLPPPPERLGGLLVAARYEAAASEALIGGDFFAVQNTRHGVRVVLGDVRGKGVGAVGTVAVAVGAFREAAEREQRLEAVGDCLDGALTREAVRRGGQDAEELFATAVLAEIPHDDTTVRLVNRGHPAPLLLRPGHPPRPLTPERPALPLGMEALGGDPVRAREYPLPAGATLLLFTDGLTEARNARGAFYDPVAALTGRRGTDPAALLDWVVTDVTRHTRGGIGDDMALLALTATPDPEHGAADRVPRNPTA
ncbi:PP2C family protein-serine/threonine phosphatase [Streptomyces sp. NPDC020965]|uniref:PP2C family protein-serine/threonine phosphatase n=1 Tax=Streptomyces sp. NPDC020965 TaxID=3365105 RepID=UPI0037B50CFB